MIASFFARLFLSSSTSSSRTLSSGNVIGNVPYAARQVQASFLTHSLPTEDKFTVGLVTHLGG